MALVSMRQLLDHAAENGYGVPAFNVNNLEQVQAIMQAADETGSPVIMQASVGARKYAGEPFLRHLILAAVESYPHIPVVMHQNHGAIRRALNQDKAEFDPRKYLKDAMLAARGICKARMEAFGTAGQAPKLRPPPRDTMAERYAAEKYAKREIRAVVN